jgi:hypothetical protein
MTIDFSKIKLNIPGWVEEILDLWETRTEPFFEVEVAEALRSAQNSHPEMSDEDFKGYYAEWSAFFFSGMTSGKSLWNTYFGPMVTIGEKASPDLRVLDEEVVLRWERRARSVRSSVMRARYADLVWDMKQTVTGQRPSHEFAQMAVDAYDESTKKSLYKIDMEGVGWLKRAFGLSLGLGDRERAKRVIGSLFSFCQAVVQPRRIGVWIVPFDLLYDHRELLSREQNARLVDDLENMLAVTSGSGKEEDFDPYGAEAAAERLARHYKGKNGKANADRVIRTYAAAFKKMALEANSLLAMAWLQPVIDRLQQDGLKREAEELLLLSAEKGKGVSAGLKTIEVKTEIKQEQVDELVEQLIGGGDLQKALAQVAHYYVPKAEAARKLLEKLKTDAPLLSMIPILMVKEDGRPTAKIGSADEDAEGRLHKQLDQTIGFYQPFLMHTLARLKERYSPTIEQILDFLCLSPLFAKAECGLLKAGLEAYRDDDFVKAIHVLVPQVEHTLRNFLGSLGIPTVKPVRNLGIMDAKSMNDVLGDDRMRQVLTEDLWRYLTVVYIDKRGLNLRNDLSHGLLTPTMFNKGVADRVFHTLLALSLLRANAEKKPEPERATEDGASGAGGCHPA